ncbi:SsrA-binding protein [Candidatus Peregrinibacteria bacterium]|nr:MAG: SsrA-binding protein [Candidatus Peregrinibacteria bacterium]
MILQKNKSAYFHFEIIKEYEVGIMLIGSEVKSCRNKHIQIKGAFIRIKDGEMFLKNTHISRYSYDQNPEYEEDRERKLLLNKNEILRITSKMKSDSLAIIPLSFYTKGPYIKVKIALARGKKKYDKRESIKKRDLNRKLAVHI